MKEILDTVVFGGYTAQDVLIVAGGVIAFFILFRVLKGVFRKEKVNKYSEAVECFGCGWRGKVSSLAGRCPKCNQPLGQRHAKR